MKSTMLLAIVAGFAVWSVAAVGALGTAQLAAANPSENCVATIQAAIADKRISSADRDAIKAACGSSAPEDCLATIKAAAADRRVTQAEAQAIRDACGIAA